MIGRLHLVCRSRLAVMLILMLVAGWAPAAHAGSIACGTTLSNGSFTLDSDLTSNSDVCLTLVGPVTLEMAGHTIACNPGLPFTNFTAIRVLGVGASVRNGKVTRCQVGMQVGQIGVHVVGKHSINGVQSFNNCDGMQLNSSKNQLFFSNISGNLCQGVYIGGESNDLVSNQANHNASEGFTVDANSNVLLLNIATGNADDGVDVTEDAHSNVLIGNAASGNGFLDLDDENPNCDSNSWFGNASVTRSPASCIH